MGVSPKRIVIALICITGMICLIRVIPDDTRFRFSRYILRPSDQAPKDTSPQEEIQLSIPPIDSHTASTNDTVIRETTLPSPTQPAGYVVFDRLYVWNGTIYAVTSNPEAFPELKAMISQPVDRKAGVDTDPTPLDMQIISPADAKAFSGESAVVIDGVSFILWDTKQFMAHYYHWWGEIILGAIRSYSSLALVPDIKLPLAEPRRFILAHVEDNTWRDRAGVNGPLMRAGWPDADIEKKDYWTDLIKLNRTFVFERAMIISRSAAHTSPLSPLWHKMIASTMESTVPNDFWKLVQERVVRNVVGYLPILIPDSGVVATHPTSKAAVVTYISRQGGGRRLLSEAHEELVTALRELEVEGICEVNVVAMEKLTFQQQLEVAARTTIMVGVHGNGLTHQLWMPSTARSTIIEIFFPQTYLHDYSMLARNMGHKHYAIWNGTYLTYPKGKTFKGVKGGLISDFNGNSIPVNGTTVANIIRERLTTPNP